MKFLDQVQNAFLLAKGDSRSVTKRFITLRQNDQLTEDRVSDMADIILKCRTNLSCEALVRMMQISISDGYDAFSGFTESGKDRIKLAVEKIVSEGTAKDALSIIDMIPPDMAYPLRQKILTSDDPHVLYAYARTFYAQHHTDNDLRLVENKLVQGAREGNVEYAVAAFQLAQALDLPVDRTRLMDSLNSPNLDRGLLMGAIESYAQSMSIHGGELHAVRFAQNAQHVPEMQDIQNRVLPDDSPVWSRQLPNADLVDTRLARKIIGEAAGAYLAAGEPVPPSLVRASASVASQASRASQARKNPVNAMQPTSDFADTGDLLRVAVKAQRKNLPSSPSMG